MMGDVLRRGLSRLLRSVSRQSKRQTLRRRDWRRTRLATEHLESRTLLSTNHISFNAASSQVYILGSSDADQVQVWSEAANLRVRFENATGIEEQTYALASVSSIQFVAGDGDDWFVNSSAIATVLWGNSGNDTLRGGLGNDRIFGGTGNDSLYGDSGDDELRGEDGDDTLFGEGGADLLIGGIGNDRLVGGTSRDMLYGDDGNDELRGDDGDDSLFGGSGRDVLIGHAGDDLLFGGTDDDTLYGNEGVDTLRGEDGNDALLGGDGADQLLGGVGNDRLFGGNDHDTMYGDIGDDTLRGENGNDSLFGDAGLDILIGGLDDDRLFGGADNDTLYGEQGNDNLRGEDGDDAILGGDGADQMNGNAGNDRLFGGADNDTLYGDDGADLLRGEDGNDTLIGGADADTLIGGIGDDRLFGGANNDTLYGEQGSDDLRGEDGNDVLFGGANDDLLVGSLGDDRLFGGSENDSLFGDDGHDDLRGEDGNDVLTGGNGYDLLLGGNGNDRQFGGADGDILHGGDGDDELRGEDGNDYITGGGGIDLVIGSVGSDRLFGGADNDVVYGEEGDDELHGDAGDDFLFGGAGRDWISGGTNNDFLYGGIDNDSLAGDAGADELRGEDGDDLQRGGDGNDYINAGAGNDIVVGDDGDDLLQANSGSDVVIGGAGVDSLEGQWGDDLLIGGITSYDGNDTILRALSAAWAALSPYEDRIAQIADELFAAHLIPGETVLDDAVADNLSGGDGQDWFFQTGSMAVYVPSDVHHHAEEGTHEDDGHHHPGPEILDHPPELEGFALVSAADTYGDRASDETIHSSLPHADTPVLQREHLSLFESVRYDQVSHYAIHDGNWSDPAIWHNGAVPTTGARVLIPLNVEVHVDGMIATRLATIRVDGKLSFDTAVNTELRVDTIAVAGSGSFEMGTVSAPIQPNVKARLLITNDGPIDRVADPFGISRGLLSHGSVSIHGAVVTSYGALAIPVPVGATIVTLKNAPVGWKIGDTIVIAATTAGTQQNEVRQIVAISGNHVWLNQPLFYSHTAARSDLDVHVANVTRNTVIESESQAIDRRGHVMFMHNPNVNIAYAGFYHLGRTNKSIAINDPVVDDDWQLQAGTGTNPRARYPVHFHRAGTSGAGPQSTIRGSAVVDAPGWGYVNHSSYVDIINNVAFEVNGSSFATEVGDEIGVFESNLAIGTTGSGEAVESRKTIQDFGHSGEGFWFQGVGITVINNISAGNAGAAYSYFARSLTENGVKKEFLSKNLPDPSIAGGAATISVGKMPMFGFSNNVGYASAEGLATWYHLEHADPGVSGLLENSTFWNNALGVNLGYTQHTVLRNLTVIHSPLATQPMHGLRGNLMTTDITYRNLTVSGYRIGIVVPTRGRSVIDGGQFDTATDIYIRTSNSRDALITGFTYTPRVSMIVDPTLTGELVSRYFGSDIVTLDFGPFANKRLYYPQQAPDAVPFPSPIVGLPIHYVGLTNQQLWSLYDVALGGAVAPAGAYTVPQILGLIAP